VYVQQQQQQQQQAYAGAVLGAVVAAEGTTRIIGMR
jgi:hypothetical protein